MALRPPTTLAPTTVLQTLLAGATCVLLASAALGRDCGDCTGEGQVTVLDALAAARHDVGLLVLTGADLEACDVDLSGAVGVLDALRISQWAVGLAVALPCPGAGIHLLAPCQASGTAELTAVAGGDLTLTGGTDFWRLDSLPVGLLGLTLEVAGPPGADHDLYVGAPGTVPGTTDPLAYGWAGTPGQDVETVVLDATSSPHPLASFGTGPIALAVSANLGPGPYTLISRCQLDLDLVPLGLTPDQPQVAAPGTFTVTREIRNLGTAEAAPSTERYFLSADPVVIPGVDLELGDHTTPGLPGGGGGLLTRTLTLPPGLPLGLYHLAVLVDADDVLAETAEGNNLLVTPAPVLEVIPGVVNVTAAAFTVPTPATIGDPVTIVRELRSTGTLATGPFQERYRISIDAIPDPGDPTVALFTVPDLLAGAVDVAPRTLSILPPGGQGLYRLLLEVDPLDLLAESNEGDNVLVRTITLENPVLDLPCGQLHTGFLAASSGAPPGVFGAHGSAVWFRVPSIPPGTGRLIIESLPGYSADLALLVGAPGTPPGSDLAASYALVSASPGSGQSITVTTTTTPSLQDYAGLPVAVALVATLGGTYGLQVTCEGLPDLTPTTLVTPASGQAGQTLTVQRSIVNQGSVASGVCTEEYVLSPDPVITHADQLIASFSLAGLAPGQISTQSRGLILPLLTPGGTYHVGLLVDGLGQVQEVNELNNALASTPVQVLPVPGSPPSIQLTVDLLPSTMNGSGTYTTKAGVAGAAFDAFLPAEGFTVDLTYQDTGIAGLDLGSLEVAASVAVSGPAGTVPAGATLTGLPGWTVGVASAQWRVPPTVGIPPQSDVTLSGRIADRTGAVSPTASLVVDLEDRSAAGGSTGDLDAWDIPGTWVLDFSRNRYDIASSGSASILVTSTLSGAAVSGPDFLEDLRVCGLQGLQSAPGAASVQNGSHVGANAIAAAWMRRTVVERVRELLGQDAQGNPVIPDAPPLTILSDDDPGAPPLAAFSSTGSFSIMGVGGDLAENPSGSLSSGVVGQAQMDLRNLSQNHDGNPGLGIFTTNIIRLGLNDPPSSAFRQELDVLVPGRGVPVGEHPLDATVLSGSFSPPAASPSELDRYLQIQDAVGFLSRIVGTKVAHEVGHSVGLVANRAPPTGLFGDEPNAPFVENPLFTNSAHVDATGNNIMAAASSFASDAATGPAAPFYFRLARAYLGGGHLYDEGR